MSNPPASTSTIDRCAPQPQLTPRQRRRRLAALAIIAAGIVTSCGGGDASPTTTERGTTSTAPPVSPTPTTAAPTTTATPTPALVPTDFTATPSRWNEVLDGIGDDGEVSVALAVDAFSLAVAPLAGSDLRRAGSDAMVPDASSAVAWALRHFAELTPEQQRDVAIALSPEDEAPSLAAGGGLRRDAPAARGRHVGCYGQIVPSNDSTGAGPLREALDDAIAEIRARLGGAIELVAPTYLLLDHRDLGIGLAYTWADPGDCSQNGMSSCTIHLSAEAESSGAAEMRSILAHEAMHCYQFQYLGMGANDLQPWVLEGLPAWVGEDIAGGSTISTSWWTRYLTTPASSLYGRDYDAIGFYAHLDEVGIDPWSRIISIFDGFSNEPAFEGAGASSGAFLDSWPSSTLRRTDIGRAWDATGPGITIDRAAPAALSVGNGGTATATVGKVSGGLFDVSISADIVTFGFDGFGRMGAEGGTDAVITSGDTFCARAGGCVCPDGTSLPYPPIAGRVVLGVSNGTSPSSVAIAGQELDCDPEEPTVDPCVVGTWVSTASYIDDQVTGAPVTELGGGAGIVLTITSSGAFTMDFDASTPSSTDMGDGVVLSTRTRGIAHGEITAINGGVELLAQDYSTTLTTQFSTGGQIAGGTGIGTGTYSCGPGSVEFRTPFELGETINAFRSA